MATVEQVEAPPPAMAATPAPAQSPAAGGDAGSATAGFGNNGGAGGQGSGGGFYDDGAASFTGVTVNFTNNQAVGGSGGSGGDGGNAFGGYGGNGGADPGATVVTPPPATAVTPVLTASRAGAASTSTNRRAHCFCSPGTAPRRDREQAKATDLITSNSAVHGAVGTAGSAGGSVAAGTGGGGSTPGKERNGQLRPTRPGRAADTQRWRRDRHSRQGDRRQYVGHRQYRDTFPNIDGTFSP